MDKRQKILFPYQIRNIRKQIEHRYFPVINRFLRDYFPTKTDMFIRYAKEKLIDFYYDFHPSADRLDLGSHGNNRGVEIDKLYRKANRSKTKPYVEVYAIGIVFEMYRKIADQSENYRSIVIRYGEIVRCLDKKDRAHLKMIYYNKWETEVIPKKLRLDEILEFFLRKPKEVLEDFLQQPNGGNYSVN